MKTIEVTLRDRSGGRMHTFRVTIEPVGDVSDRAEYSLAHRIRGAIETITLGGLVCEHVRELNPTGKEG